MTIKRIIAFVALLGAGGVVLGTGEMLVSGTSVLFGLHGIPFWLGVLALASAPALLLLRPDLLIECIVWALMHTLYRMTIVGESNVPEKGGALLVSNTVSYADHALILAALRRPVRFFMGREFYEHPLLRPVARAVRAIPVSSADSPKTIARALLEARRAVQNGELVCIFAEGGVTRIGNMLPFGRGFEFIMRGLDAPIIPMHLDRIWGSTFSFVDGKLRWRLPKVLPYPITVTIGAPLPAHTRTGDVRLAVQELSAEAFRLRGKNRKKLHVTFIREAKRHPFRHCTADSLGVSLSYAKALAGMLTFSDRLFPKLPGEAPDEKVGLLLPTSCIGLIANGAVLMAGKIPVNLNYTSSLESIRSCVRQCGMKTVITSRAFLEKVNIPPEGNMVFLEDVKPTISKAKSLCFFLAAVLLPAGLLTRLFVRGGASPDDVATIVFSSGSTGEPKGIMLTHENISSNIESVFQMINVLPGDVFMGVLPFFHSFGLTATLWLPLAAGVRVVYHPNPLDAATVGEMTARYRATILIGTPTFMAAYTRKCTPEQFSTLRLVVTGAEKLKQGIAEGFYKKYGVPPFEGYGCTELSPVVSLGIPSYIHPEGKFVQVGNKPGTVGHPIPGVAARVVHHETFEKLPVGQEGMLLIKGPNVMKGYLNDPEKTAEVVRDGWYVTGDIARIDEDGFIAITDRLSRFSKIGGEMVPHIKIEEELHDLLPDAPPPACAVTGLPDERRGERLVVLYKGGADAAALWEGLNRRPLPRLWIPKRENFYRVEEIPLLGSGKLDLRKIKQLAERCASCGR